MIDCLVKQWRSLDQTVVPLMRGNAGVMLPNPRYDRMARDVMVEQLLVAARGISANEEGDFSPGGWNPWGSWWPGSVAARWAWPW